MGTARKPKAVKAREPRPARAKQSASAHKVFPPEAYAFYDEVTQEELEAIQRRADAVLAGDKLEVIDGDGEDA